MQQEEENSMSEDALHLQEEKREKLAYEVENLTKEVALEEDKLTSTLLTLVWITITWSKLIWENLS